VHAFTVGFGLGFLVALPLGPLSLYRSGLICFGDALAYSVLGNS
jgi:hypothetical protein